MARVTVEDCLKYVDNRFELVLKAAKRARQLAMGADEPKVPWDHDKPTVVALREIAAGFTEFPEFKQASLDRHHLLASQPLRDFDDLGEF